MTKYFGAVVMLAICTHFYSMPMISQPLSERFIPFDAKTMYTKAVADLQSKGITNHRLVFANGTTIDNFDTVIVKKIVDSSAYEWNGKSYYWAFAFLTNSVHADSVFIIEMAYDTSMALQLGYSVAHKSRFQVPDTLGIADTAWINSDSVAKLPRLQNNPLGYWKYFFDQRAQRYVSVSLRRMKLTGGVPFNTWKIYGGVDQFMYFDAGTGALIHDGHLVGVQDERLNEIGHRVKLFQNSHAIRLQTESSISIIQLYTVLGEHVCTWNNVEPNQELSVSHLQTGLYMLRYEQQGTFYTTPIVIER